MGHENQCSRFPVAVHDPHMCQQEKGKREKGKVGKTPDREDESRKPERTKTRKGEQEMAGTHASFPIFFGLSFFRAFVIARFPCFSVSFPLFPFSQFSLSYTRLDSGVLPELPSRKTLVLPIFKLDFSE